MKRHRMVLTSVFLRGGFLTLCIFLGVVSNQVFRSEVSVAQQVGRSEGTFSGQVLAWRELTLTEGVNAEEFERFVAEEFTPAFEEYVPGVRSYILKGQRGDRKGAYAWLILFDSATTRDFYFPREGEGDAGVPAEAQKLWQPGREAVFEGLARFVDSISETEGYTDYVIVQRR